MVTIIKVGNLAGPIGDTKMCTPWINHIFEKQGMGAAYNAACDEIAKQRADIAWMMQTRFFKRLTRDDGTKKLYPCTEQEISRAYDTDYYDEAPPPYFYCDDNGELQPVTVGKMERHADYYDDDNIVIGSAYLIANGENVGTVIYTDH